MKNIISIFLFGVLILNPMFGNLGDPPADVLKLRLYLEFGHGRHCSGWGICDSDIIIYSDRSGLGLPGGMLVSPELKTFELTFSNDDLVKYQPEKLVEVEGKQTVTFDEHYVFPKSVQEAAESDRELVIKAGTYPLTYANGMYSIVFPY